MGLTRASDSVSMVFNRFIILHFRVAKNTIEKMKTIKPTMVVPIATLSSLKNVGMASEDKLVSWILKNSPNTVPNRPSKGVTVHGVSPLCPPNQ